MRLNPDCVRDLLLTFEEFTEASQNYIIPDWDEIDYCEDFPLLAKYPASEIAYTVQQCVANGFLMDAKIPCDGGLVFSDISPKAHEFLENIRSDTNWNKVKNISKQVGSFSLSALGQIATNVIENLIQSQFPLIP